MTDQEIEFMQQMKYDAIDGMIDECDHLDIKDSLRGTYCLDCGVEVEL